MYVGIHTVKALGELLPTTLEDYILNTKSLHAFGEVACDIVNSAEVRILKQKKAAH